MPHGFQSYLFENGIESQTSCAYTPEQNGVAERKNGHSLKVTSSTSRNECSKVVLVRWCANNSLLD